MSGSKAILAHTIEDFKYVVPERTQNPIFFLSKMDREVLPRRGTTRFESEFLQQELPNITPNTYEIPSSFSMIRNKASSNLGGRALRFQWRPSMAPSPATYNMCSFPAKFKPNKVPFNMTAVRLPMPKSKTPGVGTYSPATSERNRRIQFRHSFNGRKTMIPAVEIKCCAVNMDVCQECLTKPEGDYWHHNYHEFLCRSCMALKNPKETTNYKKIRDCGFMHSHEETTAKIHLMDRKELRRFQQREAFLGRYFK